MKKIISLFIIGVLMFNLVGCGKKKSISENSTEVNETYEEYIPDDVDREIEYVEENNSSEYYSFLIKDGEGLKFNITVDEYLNNYNVVMDNYGVNSKDISFSDFSYVENGFNFNNTPIVAYSCPYTIIGKNDDIQIIINKEENGNKLTAKQSIFGYENNDGGINPIGILKYEQYKK